jgi:hypothetical protein
VVSPQSLDGPELHRPQQILSLVLLALAELGLGKLYGFVISAGRKKPVKLFQAALGRIARGKEQHGQQRRDYVPNQ